MPGFEPVVARDAQGNVARSEDGREVIVDTRGRKSDKASTERLSRAPHNALGGKRSNVLDHHHCGLDIGTERCHCADLMRVDVIEYPDIGRRDEFTLCGICHPLSPRRASPLVMRNRTTLGGEVLESKKGRGSRAKAR